MSSSSSSLSLLDLSFWGCGSTMHDDDSLLQEAEKTLEHELSQGNNTLRSIDAAWLEQHKDLLELFISNPNDPVVLEQIMPPSSQIDACQPVPGQFAALRGPLAFAALPQRISSASLPRWQPITAGYTDPSPFLATPHMQATASTECREIRSARSEPIVAAPGSSSSLNRDLSNLVPEVSLAARAGSRGATSMLTSNRSASGGSKKSVAHLLRSSDSDEMEAEGGTSERQIPGRKKRTAPILVETEEGETKYVTPSEFRKLRRRITNRLSARRMRKKQADERASIKNTTQSLEEERDYYRLAYETQQQQMQELQERYNRLEITFRSLNAQLGISNIASLQPQPPQLQPPSQLQQPPQFATFPVASASTRIPLEPGYMLPYSSPQGAAAATNVSAVAFANEEPGVGVPDIPASLAAPPTDPLPLFRRPPASTQPLASSSQAPFFQGARSWNEPRK